MKIKKKIVVSPAVVAVTIFQIMSLLPLIYLFLVSDSIKVMSERGIAQVLFDVGVSSLPRWETLLLSVLYRMTANEVMVYFGFLIAALVFGVIFKRLIRDGGKKKKITLLVFALLICADLVVRLLPLGFNRVFGLAFGIVGFFVRAAELALCLWELIGTRRKENITENDAG